MSEYDLNNPQSDVESYLANMDGILAPLPLPPESNVEKYLAHIVGVWGVELPHKPDSRVEAYLEKLALDPPQPVTPILVEKSITNNGVYSAGDDNADGYSKVTVEVSPPEDSYQLKSITTPTSLATFNASEMPMPSLKVSIEAKQDLHGYDKPWPAGGGKNKLNPSAPVETFDLTGEGTYIRYGISFEGNKTYTIVNTSSSSGFYYRTPKSDLSDRGTSVQILANSYATVVVPSDCILWIFTALTSVWETYVADFAVNIGNDTEYTPYSNDCPISGWSEVVVSDVDDVDNPTVTQTITISLGQTVYGAEVDVVNGVLRITWKSVDMGSLTWSYSPTYTRFSSTGVQNEIKSGNNQDEVMCSCYGNVANEDMNAFKTTNGLIMVKDSNYTDTATFKQSVIGQQFVYMLETPIIIPLTPSLIKSLNGQNNLSVDCGEILEGEYFIAL